MFASFPARRDPAFAHAVDKQVPRSAREDR